MKELKDYTIDEIQAITEPEAGKLAEEKITIKDHNIYFIDFSGYFGYSYLVFRNNHHIYYANDYELHNKYIVKKEGRAGLKANYLKALKNKLYTDLEFSEELKSYSEYRSKSDYLHNHYAHQVDRLSVWASDKEAAKFEGKKKNMIYDPVGFCYVFDKEFVHRHIKLLEELEEAFEKAMGNYDFIKSAFLYEMYNHEYGINYQADYDTLSCFGNVKWHHGDLNAYFEELGFSEMKKQAYLDARVQYYKNSDL